MPAAVVVAAYGGGAPGVPTIGTAVAGNTIGTVVFTPPSYTGKGGGDITYRAISTPGNLTATAGGSPINVSGLTNGVGYTFQVRAETSYGAVSEYSTASNSITPVAPAPPPPPSPPPPPPPPPPSPPAPFCICVYAYTYEIWCGGVVGGPIGFCNGYVCITDPPGCVCPVCSPVCSC